MNAIHRPRVLAAAIVSILVAAGCRTAKPVVTVPFTPLQTESGDVALKQLTELRQQVKAVRSIMRIRATSKGKTQSFRAQLDVNNKGHVEFVGFTPIGTQAFKLVADNDDVVFRATGEDQAFRGSAGQMASQFGMLGTQLSPAELALLIAGLPPVEGFIYEAEPTGLKHAIIGDLTADFDPPAFPPKKVTLQRGEDRLEVEHLELVRVP